MYVCPRVCHHYHYHPPVISTDSTLAVSQFNYIGTASWALPTGHIVVYRIHAAHCPACILYTMLCPANIYTIHNTVPRMYTLNTAMPCMYTLYRVPYPVYTAVASMYIAFYAVYCIEVQCPAQQLTSKIKRQHCTQHACDHHPPLASIKCTHKIHHAHKSAKTVG